MVSAPCNQILPVDPTHTLNSIWAFQKRICVYGAYSQSLTLWCTFYPVFSTRPIFWVNLPTLNSLIWILNIVGWTTNKIRVDWILSKAWESTFHNIIEFMQICSCNDLDLNWAFIIRRSNSRYGKSSIRKFTASY